MNFIQFMGPPGTTAAFATVIAGGLKPWRTSTCSAER
jgi:hypothetical protein